MRSHSLRLGEEIPEAIEAALPFGAAVADPVLGGGESGGIDAAGADAAQFFGPHQAAFFQDLQMLHDGGQADGQGFGELGDGDGPFADLPDESPPGRVA